MKKELIARINKILFRNKKNTIIKIKDIEFDLDKMVVYKEKQEINLTSLELKILNLLFSNINKVVTRNDIIEKIWEWTGNDVNDNTVTVYLKRIREKLGTDIIIHRISGDAPKNILVAPYWNKHKMWILHGFEKRIDSKNK